MRLNDDELKTLWRAETAHVTGGRPDCLSTDVLARAGAGEMSTVERARVADHLSRCADCAEEYRITLSVKDWAEQAASDHAEVFPTRPASIAPRVNWWQHLAGRLFPVAGFGPFAAVLTATLLLVSVALGAWLLSLRQQNRAVVAQLNQKRSEAVEDAELRSRVEELQRQQAELRAQLAQQSPAGQEVLKAEAEKLKKELQELSQPQLDQPQVDVDPNGATRGGGGKGGTTTVNVPSSASSFTINMPGAGSKPFPSYLIELVDARTNKVIWSGQRRQDKETTFTLTLAKRSIPAGQYRIRVSGLGGKAKEPLADYDIQIKYPTHPAQQTGR